MWKFVILLVATLALVSAQDAPAATVPQNCSAIVESLDWNNTALFGTWQEVARNPIGDAKACLEFTVGLLHDNVTLSINASHSSSSTSLFQNVDEKANVTLVANAKTGYNVTFFQGSTPQAPVYIKLLQIVNSTYITGCGYTNATDNSTSYGFILGAPNKYTAEGIKLVNDGAFPLYNNFLNNTYANITQQGCSRNSAAQSLPLISGVLALALLLIKAH
ncbi:uncharacterized protein [Drosophila virilis]|uniref:Lipocalin/cytosolic fatty-acid binding domain-containing protein n=1 Tax=Drosophila virilis TaxID=7244 RepID=B4M438_DROVI|nr:uncharacterized protein LOC6633229 [Drosophila virilis]EDW59399.1 uncharacterized protein Dvir_GJ10865 [Drosophila virilis]